MVCFNRIHTNEICIRQEPPAIANSLTLEIIENFWDIEIYISNHFVLQTMSWVITSSMMCSWKDSFITDENSYDNL